jgi:hypothetical protein
MLMLGQIIFQDWEIPEKIKFGGKQMLAVHKLIGGDRVTDAMGPDPDDIEWTGRFQYGDVLSRARMLEAMRDAGNPVLLICDEIARTVIVSSFEFEYERPYQAPYKICCSVIPDSGPAAAPTLDSLISGDMTLVSQLLSF